MSTFALHIYNKDNIPDTSLLSRTRQAFREEWDQMTHSIFFNKFMCKVICAMKLKRLFLLFMHTTPHESPWSVWHCFNSFKWSGIFRPEFPFIALRLEKSSSPTLSDLVGTDEAKLSLHWVYYLKPTLHVFPHGCTIPPNGNEYIFPSFSVTTLISDPPVSHSMFRV